MSLALVFSLVMRGGEEVRREGDMVYSPRQLGHCIIRSPPATVGLHQPEACLPVNWGDVIIPAAVYSHLSADGRVGVVGFHAAARPDYIRNTPRFVSTGKQISPRSRHPQIYLCFWGFASSGYFI